MLKGDRVEVRTGGGFLSLADILNKVAYPELRKILKKMDESDLTFNQSV
jgi:hypothetical protein